MSAPVGSFICVGTTWFNANEIREISLVGDDSGVAHMIYGGGDNHIVLNMGDDDAGATDALNTALDPVDFTTNVA